MDLQLLLRFSYAGAPFRGVQPQPGVPTVGGALLSRIANVAGEMPYAVSFAARTDAGVAAHENFMSCRLRSGVADVAALCEKISRPANDALTRVSVTAVPFRIMVRSSALSKTYVYALPAAGLDLAAMRTAAGVLVGTHDFKAFRSLKCNARQARKTLTRIDVEADAGVCRLVVEGDGFLRYMVRIIAGTLAEIGEQRRDVASITKALTTGERSDAGPKASADGLTLWRVQIEDRLRAQATVLRATPPQRSCRAEARVAAE